MAEQKSLAVISKEIETGALAWVNEQTTKGGIKFPANYSPENALKSAMLILAETKTGKDSGYRPVLEVCTKTSIAYSLQKMLTWGLNPAKKQLYFMAFKDKLGIMESYFGVYHMAKQMGNVKEVNCQVVYKGDIFKFDIKNGVKIITEHSQTLESMDSGEIIATYAIVIYNDGKVKTEIMTMGQIKKSWAKSTYGFNKDTHGDFAEEMCKRTVLKKAVKLDVNSSDDSHLFIDDDISEAEEVKTEIKSTAKTVIDIEEARYDISDAEEVKEEQEDAGAALFENKEPEPKDDDVPDFMK